MTDLFGNTTLGAQHSLFGDDLPDPERGRRRLHGLLETARNATSMPWDARKASMWQIVFPQMANWLPDDEADQLRFEFAQELERLKLAA